MPSFYYPNLDDSTAEFALSKEESQHVVKARRLRQGDSLQVLNGSGGIAACTLMAIEGSIAYLKVDDFTSIEARDRSLTVASALPKGDRLRTMIDMLAQLGVERFVPLKCDRSIQKCNSSVLVKMQRYALEACKQSNNPWLMAIGEEQTLTNLIEGSCRSSAQGCYADANGQAPAQVFDGARDHWVAIGPEGGFSEREVSELESATITPIGLGRTILRTETAAVASAASWTALAPTQWF